ncbi:hypothetical protein SAMN05660479_00537 [Microbulbifer thermotolerans]|nr:hypothetical protein SAMN05660479_00537 [Microbulbifer thermotolerans]
MSSLRVLCQTPEDSKGEIQAHVDTSRAVVIKDSQVIKEQLAIAQLILQAKTRESETGKQNEINWKIGNSGKGL